MISAAIGMLENEGQQNELAEFYKKNKSRIYSVAYSRLRNREASEDAIQETFLNIVKYPKGFFGVEEHKKISYVLTVLGNTISRSMRDPMQNSFDELDEETEGETLSVEDVVIGNIAAEELKYFISQLPEARRSVIELKAVHGLSNSQIADILGISEEAVRKRISNTYKQIKSFLDLRNGRYPNNT